MFFDDARSHHLESWTLGSRMQMGQPSSRADQRQQTDNLPGHDRADMHGLEREIQFDDMYVREIQAVG